MVLDKISEPSVSEEDKVDGIAAALYKRMHEETERILKKQLKILKVDTDRHSDILENLHVPSSIGVIHTSKRS